MRRIDEMVMKNLRSKYQGGFVTYDGFSSWMTVCLSEFLFVCIYVFCVYFCLYVFVCVFVCMYLCVCVCEYLFDFFVSFNYCIKLYKLILKFLKQLSCVLSINLLLFN